MSGARPHAPGGALPDHGRYYRSLIRGLLAASRCSELDNRVIGRHFAALSGRLKQWCLLAHRGEPPAPVFRHGQPVYESVLDSEDLSAGLFAVQPGREIPVHDRPGRGGLLLGLSGELTVNSYSFRASRACFPGEAPMECTLETATRIGPAEFHAFAPREDRVHTLKAQGTPCLVFDIQFFSPPEAFRCWPAVVDEADQRNPLLSQ